MPAAKSTSRHHALSTVAATTLVTLFTMASSQWSVPMARAASRPGVDSPAVRLVAAAVAAAARDLLTGDHAVIPGGPYFATAPVSGVSTRPVTDAPIVPDAHVGDRLLALPPPRA
ncbi:MAG: hypothetical protein KDA25_01460 [Phycisphaerales bacterium]|nr:hypothetical protein [Phycisphaerales bacterium]